MTHRRILLVLLLISVLAVAACDDSESGLAQLEVLLTDAPSDYIESADVIFSRVYLKGGPNDVDLLDPEEDTVTYDLLQLRDGIEARLAGGLIPADEYAQLRLVVESATVTLADGVTFTDGSSTATLFVPSGMQSGIKVQLSEPIVAEDGSLTIIVVDFDVDESFVIHGNPEAPDGVTDIKFTPLLKEKSRNGVS